MRICHYLGFFVVVVIVVVVVVVVVVVRTRIFVRNCTFVNSKPKHR